MPGRRTSIRDPSLKVSVYSALPAKITSCDFGTRIVLRVRRRINFAAPTKNCTTAIKVIMDLHDQVYRLLRGLL
jgi:hypothetical protein